MIKEVNSQQTGMVHIEPAGSYNPQFRRQGFIMWQETNNTQTRTDVLNNWCTLTNQKHVL
jgi:hypothetical protein